MTHAKGLRIPFVDTQPTFLAKFLGQYCYEHVLKLYTQIGGSVRVSLVCRKAASTLLSGVSSASLPIQARVVLHAGFSEVLNCFCFHRSHVKLRKIPRITTRRTVPTSSGAQCRGQCSRSCSWRRLMAGHLESSVVPQSLLRFLHVLRSYNWHGGSRWTVGLTPIDRKRDPNPWSPAELLRYWHMEFVSERSVPLSVLLSRRALALALIFQ